ncbi:MAG: bifunctional helix-turn-helix transcriptional regulator/GNAT family N-acetyltransferase [Bacteroidota bacterium]
MYKIKDIGKMALGSRLRVLSESMTESAKVVYDLYDVPLKPKWFPVFYIVSKQDDLSILAIAEKIGHTHPSVIKIVKELKEAGIVTSSQNQQDARKTNINLTNYGKRIATKIEVQYEDINAVVEDMIKQQTHNIWKALDELEFLLSEKSLFRRIQEQKKMREAKLISIEDYRPELKTAFKALNQAWIEQYFTMEASDFKALDHPEENILDKGGAILFAFFEGKVAGVCALIKMDSPVHDFELAKMAVSPKFQGKGIGYALGQATITRAKDLGAKAIYLESNTVLGPALKLYQKLGFQKIQGIPSPYERCNIQMELSNVQKITSSFRL